MHAHKSHAKFKSLQVLETAGSAGVQRALQNDALGESNAHGRILVDPAARHAELLAVRLGHQRLVELALLLHALPLGLEIAARALEERVRNVGVRSRRQQHL